MEQKKAIRDFKVLTEKISPDNVAVMAELIAMRETKALIEDFENNYFFSPSISKRKTVDRQTYYVRRYFRGGKDFEKTMKTIAVQRTTNNAK